MATIHKTAHIHAAPEQVWSRIAAVDKVHEILPAVVACRLEGDRRTCTFADGAVLQERIISVDAALRRLAYTITASPFGLEYHCASMQVNSDGTGTRLEWTTDVKPDGAAQAFAPMFDQLFGQLCDRLASA